MLLDSKMLLSQIRITKVQLKQMPPTFGIYRKLFSFSSSGRAIKLTFLSYKHSSSRGTTHRKMKTERKRTARVMGR